MAITNNSQLTGSKVYVAGHRGLAGSALMRRLEREGCATIITRPHGVLDLTDREGVLGLFSQERPEYVFLAAAKVGGILANNTRPAEFIYDNLAIQTNVIQAAHEFGVKRLLFLGSSCIYPLESTNRAYAVAKIAGIEMCWAFNRQYGTKYVAAMPTNLYGPNDNYDLENSHVLPALLRKMHDAKMTGAAEVSVWGTGSVRREFLHSDDMADACVFLMNLPEEVYGPIVRSESQAPLFNVGCGDDLTVRELAELIRDVIGFEGRLAFDTSKPDGTPRKLLDLSRMNRLGWQASIHLREGLTTVYQDCLTSVASRERSNPARWSG